MIFLGETTKEDKKSIFLICVRDKQELEQLLGNNNSTNEDSKDILVSNENTNVSSGDTNDSEYCTEMLPSNSTNELNDGIIPQPECEIACESNNVKMNNPIRADNESSNENVDSGSDKLDVIPTMNRNENTESNTWDDYDCYKISQEAFFPSKIMDLDTQKLVITRFLNFYVGGKVPKGLRASDVIFAVISIIPLTGATEEFIWHKSEYRDDGSLFFITPEEKLNTEFKAIVTKAKQNCTFNNNNSITNTSSSIKSLHKNERINNTTSATSHDDTSSKTVEENHNIGSNVDSNTSSLNEKDIVSSYITNLIFDMSIKWHGLTSSGEPSKQSFKQYGPAENSAFISSCNKLLLAWEKSEESRVMLKYFFGIIALTLMRGIVKGKKNIINTFINEKFQKRILFTNSKINYSRPHESCIEKCCKELKLNERHHKVMFAKILFNSIRIDYMQHKNHMTPYYGFYNIFRMCVIDHIAYYDMGIINLLKTIYSCTGPGIQFSIILDDLKSEETNHSMEQIKNFILKYMTKTNCLTYHWARYFDSKQFEYLSCSTSYATAVVLAVFVEKMTRSADVWRSGWVRTQCDDLDRYKELAQQMYEEFEHLQNTKNVLCQQFFSVH